MTCSRANRKPFGVSRYRCRGGLPGPVASHDVSSSSRSAKRKRIGYSVPDFRPVLRLMSYPYFQSFGASRNASRTCKVCGDNRRRSVIGNNSTYVANSLSSQTAPRILKSGQGVCDLKAQCLQVPTRVLHASGIFSWLAAPEHLMVLRNGRGGAPGLMPGKEQVL